MKPTRSGYRNLRFSFLLCTILLFVSELLTDEIDSPATKAITPGVVDPTSTSGLVLNSVDRAIAFERSVALYKILDQAEEEELTELLRNARDIEPANERHNAQIAIASRFASINPQEALKVALEFPDLQRGSLIEGIFSEWSESDLASAIEAAAKLDQDSRLTALKSISGMRDDLDLDELRSIARELGHPGYANELQSKVLTIDLAENPTEAWHKLMHDGLEDATQLKMLVDVAEAAVEREGLDVLFHLYAPLSRVLFEEEYLVMDTTVETLVRNNPENTWKYVQSGPLRNLSQLDEATDTPSGRSWSQRDRAHMINVVQELLLKSWAAWDPAFVLESIEEIPRQLQALACERAIEALMATEPELAVEYIESLKHLGAGGEQAVWRSLRSWSAVDPLSALNWVQSESGGKYFSRDEDLLRTVLLELVLVDPKRALQEAALGPNSSRLEAQVIDELAKEDVEAAIEMLLLVSEDGQHYSNAAVAYQLIENGDVDRAVALRRQYEHDSGESVNWFWFFATWAQENPVQLYERLDDLPPELRFEGAHALNHYYLPELTQEQKDTVKAIYEAGQN